MTDQTTPCVEATHPTRKNRNSDQLDLLEDAPVWRQAGSGATNGASKAHRHTFADKIDPSANLSPVARASDPATSHDAAEAVRPSRLTQMRKLLEVYAQYEYGLTDEEACDLAGIPNGWRRCSDLRNLDRGWITPVLTQEGDPLTRTLSSGRAGQICVITMRGKVQLEQRVGAVAQ